MTIGVIDGLKPVLHLPINFAQCRTGFGPSLPMAKTPAEPIAVVKEVVGP